jgi:hypothetical protein
VAGRSRIPSILDRSAPLADLRSVGTHPDVPIFLKAVLSASVLVVVMLVVVVVAVTAIAEA